MAGSSTPALAKNFETKNGKNGRFEIRTSKKIEKNRKRLDAHGKHRSSLTLADLFGRLV